jgi:hypothetical protein
LLLKPSGSIAKNTEWLFESKTIGITTLRNLILNQV